MFEPPLFGTSQGIGVSPAAWLTLLVILFNTIDKEYLLMLVRLMQRTLVVLEHLALGGIKLSCRIVFVLSSSINPGGEMERVQY